MDIDLAAATSAMDQIRAKFDSVEEDGKRAVGEAKAEAKRQRQVLVNAALSSLNSLRTHLVATLTGLREDAAPAQKQMATQVATDDDGAKLAWNAAQGRWALMSEGKMDHLVIRVAVPPPMGIRGFHSSVHDLSGAPNTELSPNMRRPPVEGGSLPPMPAPRPALQGRRPPPTVIRGSPPGTGGFNWQSPWQSRVTHTTTNRHQLSTRQRVPLSA